MNGFNPRRIPYGSNLSGDHKGNVIDVSDIVAELRSAVHTAEEAKRARAQGESSGETDSRGYPPLFERAPEALPVGEPIDFAPANDIKPTRQFLPSNERRPLQDVYPWDIEPLERSTRARIDLRIGLVGAAGALIMAFLIYSGAGWRNSDALLVSPMDLPSVAGTAKMTVPVVQNNPAVPDEIASSHVVEADKIASSPTAAPDLKQSLPTIADTDLKTAEAREAAGNPAPVQGTAAVSGPETERMLKRVDVMLKQGDISGARLILDRLAESGQPRAAFRLAETYDVRMLAQWNVRGLKGDAGKARELYRRALNGGVVEAGARIEALK